MFSRRTERGARGTRQLPLAMILAGPALPGVRLGSTEAICGCAKQRRWGSSPCSRLGMDRGSTCGSDCPRLSLGPWLCRRLPQRLPMTYCSMGNGSPGGYPGVTHRPGELL
jgi:hypothetical protein